ncbi:TetR family transcriptional regulator [Paenibacillus sp. CCS19]|uniref:TetR/AcrR family transcriptional regulator n=1 Tax=Paenibacillus sp. CCS19 TaxID=3158387 RepID=UPI00256884F5|nr:TetR/AcrR family transcriptional regulator [Paenibacillus cellulosilyticus]GMK41204.1 TetR family transcriptional regulator [Paenibacillus cellulosilyticus]
MSSDIPSRRPGRPRSEQADEAILRAARELMLEYGVQSFSMDTLAQRANVSKPTIYRRWGTKDELLTDAFGYASEQTVVPDTGDALLDLRQLLEQMLASFNSRFEGKSYSAHKMIAGMLDSPQFIAQYEQNFIQPRRKAYQAIILRGKRSGQIREDANEETLVDLVSGSYLYCLLFKPSELASGQWLEQVWRLLEDGIGRLRT